jgi:hypothetical protein
MYFAQLNKADRKEPSMTTLLVPSEDRRAWLRALSCAVLFASVAMTPSWAEETTTAAQAEDSAVRLVVDYGDGVQKHFTQLQWREGMTVFDVMQAAMRHRRGVRVKYRGKGATLLVTEIDEQKSEAAGAGSRNWIYRINGQLGERSAGIAPVKAGDTVLWSFETYR